MGIEGADAHETVHTGFALEVSKGIFALNLHGDTFDAGTLAVEAVGDGHAVVVCFGIADVHAHEHFSPVLCLHSACAGIDRQYCVEAVAFALKHVLQLKSFDEGLGDVNLLDDLFFGGVAAVEEFAKHL